MDIMEVTHHSSLREDLGSLTAYTMFLRYNVLSQHMPVFGKVLVRPEVIDRGPYIHLTEL